MRFHSQLDSSNSRGLRLRHSGVGARGGIATRTLLKTFPGMLIKGIVGLALATVILSQVAEHSGPSNGTAYVHVTSPEVDVLIDGWRYHVKSLWDSPIVCELRPGTHTLQMVRNGSILYEEEFKLRASEEVVLTAWEKAKGLEKKGISR